MSSPLVTGLKYGGTLLLGMFAGGVMMQRAIQKAMMKNYESVMGGANPEAIQAMAQQMGLGGMPGIGQSLNVMEGANQGMPVAPQAPVVNAMPKMQVQRTPISPLNLTASQLGTGRLTV